VNTSARAVAVERRISMTEWIERMHWSMPVSPNTYVEICGRDKTETKRGYAGDFGWGYCSDGESNINFYRVLREDTEGVAGIRQDNSMIKAVEKLTLYMTSYDGQEGYEDYMTKTYVDDIVYGLGISLSKEYETATGFAKFKADLLEYLTEDADKTDAAYRHYKKQLGGNANE